jgi:hypothetical protein
LLGRVTGGGLPLELHFLVFRKVCLEEREVELLSKMSFMINGAYTGVFLLTMHSYISL